jgi:hypothetical protein
MSGVEFDPQPDVTGDVRRRPDGIPWISRDAREQQRMIDHVIGRLNDETALSAIQEAEFDTDLLAVPRRISKEEAMSYADRGDYKFLRRLYPHLAKYLNPSAPAPLVQGQRPPHKNVYHRYWASMIVNDVKRIRRIWLEDFNRRRRPETAEPSAANIVAVYRGIDIGEVRAALKLLSR